MGTRPILQGLSTLLLTIAISLWLMGCAQTQPASPEPTASPTETGPGATALPTSSPTAAPEGDEPVDDEPLVDVISVQVSGEAGSYTFRVEVSSPDTGCEQYADWWEVVSEEGALIYRRILLHSHVDEQPFVRSGGPVEVAADAVVLVRAHLHPSGYGGQMMRGSVAEGFTAVPGDPDFAPDLETAPPKPDDCAF